MLSLVTIACPVNQAAGRYKDLPALISANRAISYAEYENMVSSVSAALRQAGVAKGQRVAVISDNRPEYPPLLFALFRIGAVACPISPRYPGREIGPLLDMIDCMVVCDPLGKLYGGEREGLLRLDLNAVEGVRPVVANDPEEAMVDLTAWATIIFTSGSSARPKAALHTFGNHYYSALGSNENIAVEPGDRWLLSLPPYHVSGISILFRTLLGGGAVVIAGHDKDLVDSIEKYRITHLSVVSTQLYRMVESGLSPAAVDRLKAVLVGGSSVPASLVMEARDRGWPICTTYGLTEMSSQVTTTRPGDSKGRLLTSGRLLSYRDLKLDHDGEILVKGETLFSGYVDRAVVSLPVDGEGWFQTGDIGAMDGQGYLKVTGRKDNMFISGGENIHPEEIERALCLWCEASEAVVVPVEDREFGFRPVAFVRGKAGCRIDQEGLGSCLERRLPGFKIPVAFFELPEKGEGQLKPDRRTLATLARELTASHKSRKAEKGGACLEDHCVWRHT